MNFYKIDIERKEKDFISLYSTLEEIGFFSIYKKLIILKSEESIETVKEKIKKTSLEEDVIHVSLIKNEKDITNNLAKSWYMQESFIEKSIEAKKQYEESMEELHNVLTLAEKYLKEGGV